MHPQLADTRTGLINNSVGARIGPQGLKPAFLAAASGTAKAVPFHKTIYETCSKPRCDYRSRMERCVGILRLRSAQALAAVSRACPELSEGAPYPRCSWRIPKLALSRLAPISKSSDIGRHPRIGGSRKLLWRQDREQSPRLHQRNARAETQGFAQVVSHKNYRLV